jgi:hypothetical protein
MNHIRKEANLIRTRTEGRTRHRAGRHIISRNHIILCGQMNPERMPGSFVSIMHLSEQEFALPSHGGRELEAFPDKPKSTHFADV